MMIQETARTSKVITLNDPYAYGIASCVKLAMTKAREKLINQLAIMILKYTQFVIRQCLKGKSVA